jgi:tellurium resistance protein TerD
MIELSKDGGSASGAVVNLEKEAGHPVRLLEISLTWAENTTSGKAYDPDVVAFVLGPDDKVVNGDAGYFVRAFPPSAPTLKSTDGAVTHSGDDTTGAGGGEKLVVDASKFGSPDEKVRVAVTIFHAKGRHHNFGLIKKLKIVITDITDPNNRVVLVTGDLTFDNAVFTSMNAADIMFHNGSLFAQYLGEGYDGGLGGLCADHGIQVGRNAYDEGDD